MKQRLKKKLLKKMRAAGLLHLEQQLELTGTAKLLALECWRIKKLLPEFCESKKGPVLRSSIEKLIGALAESGIEIEDPEGMPYRDGMTMEVALFEETPQIPHGAKIITETLEPTIYVKNKLVQPARVIVSVGVGSE
jgi:hypothetical protein